MRIRVLLQIQIWHNWRTNSWAMCGSLSVCVIQNKRGACLLTERTAYKTIIYNKYTMLCAKITIPDKKTCNLENPTITLLQHYYICCLRCGIFRQLHCYWPLCRSPTNTPGFALIKATSHSRTHRLCAHNVSSVSLSTCWTHPAHKWLPEVAGIQARNVLEVGHMFPHWLDETNLFLDWGCWYELNHKHALWWHYRRGSSAWSWRGGSSAWSCVAWRQLFSKLLITNRNKDCIGPHIKLGERRHYSTWQI